MIPENYVQIPSLCDELLGLIKGRGVDSWLTEAKIETYDLDCLIYLCKFGFFTGILTKKRIAEILDLDRRQRRDLVKSWYDDHRAKGCGTC